MTDPRLHFLTPLLTTPFHLRTAAHNRRNDTKCRQ